MHTSVCVEARSSCHVVGFGDRAQVIEPTCNRLSTLRQLPGSHFFFLQLHFLQIFLFSVVNQWILFRKSNLANFYTKQFYLVTQGSVCPYLWVVYMRLILMGEIPVIPLDFVELCVCVQHLKRPGEDSGSPGSGVIGLCEPPTVGDSN